MRGRTATANREECTVWRQAGNQKYRWKDVQEQFFLVVEKGKFP